MKKTLAIFGVLLFTMSSISVVRSQCPMCSTALESNRADHEKTTVGNGINKGILFLLATPYVLVGTAGLFYYRVQRQKKKNA